ncbi:MAG: hypothetical protein K8J08_11505 [Thermoanaerobaculia bacterium]|nr:hypothetical protein [Thermoanaerobaculia bacterium]
MNKLPARGDQPTAAHVIREEVCRVMDDWGMTYHEACRRLDMPSVSRIHWLRNNIRHWPEPELFHKLCAAFRLDPEELLREAGYLEELPE